MAAPYNMEKIIHSELGSDYSHIGLFEPYHDISSVFISNKTVSFAGALHWQVDTLGGGGGANCILLSSSSARQAQ